MAHLLHTDHARMRIPTDLTTTDRSFDGLLPRELRQMSMQHWTPVDVAIRATSLLKPTTGMRILDVGSGVGKMCTIGALASRATWVGVEQHAFLIDAARDLARHLGVDDRTQFEHGDAFSIEWNDFDALYLYNPFEFSPTDSRATRGHVYERQVALVHDRLAALGRGARVVTLNGFGGIMPPTFELVYHERFTRIGLDLVMWRQGVRARTDRHEHPASI